MLLSDSGYKPDAILLSRERFTAHEGTVGGAITLDGSENASVQFAQCCRPVPGDAIVGYLGRGEGLVVHVHDCGTARKLLLKDSERFIGVDWSEDPVRAFETGIVVTVNNTKGILAKVAAALAGAEADIVHIDMAQEATQEANDLRFLISVRDATHLEQVLRHVRRTPSVLGAIRTGSGSK